MVLPGMNLADHSAYTRPAIAYEHENVLRHEPFRRKIVDDLDVSQPLLVCADLVHALYDIYPLVAKNATGFNGCAEIQIQDRFMVLLVGLCDVVSVISLVILMTHMSRPAGRVHVRRIEDYAINLTIAVGQCASINALLKVSRQQTVMRSWDAFPEHAPPVCDVRNGASTRHKEVEDLREQIVVCANAGREDQVIGRDTIRRLALALAFAIINVEQEPHRFTHSV